MNAPKLINNKPAMTGSFIQVDLAVYREAAHKLTQNEFLLFLLLVGTKNGYGISESFIKNNTGIGQNNLTRVRNGLINKGFIKYTQYGSYEILYDNIMSDTPQIEVDSDSADETDTPQNEWYDTPQIEVGIPLKLNGIHPSNRGANTPQNEGHNIEATDEIKNRIEKVIDTAATSVAASTAGAVGSLTSSKPSYRDILKNIGYEASQW